MLAPFAFWDSQTMRLILLVLAAATSIAATPAPERALGAALETIRAAALSRDTARAEVLMLPALVLVSQSGKVYGKAEALADLGNGFEQWDNSEVALQRQGGWYLVTLVNARKRPGLDALRFRVMQVWIRSGRGWQLAAQSSTRIAATPGSAGGPPAAP
jgi:Domain of unknown function (DUF4440)